ncbi:uncharacterized protein LOC132638352 [Lycium barbarum]|uniref:uncharacterized protein LOC132638352 n=1 Tax=Lycium barbarum TaxID=112863 RepID=UPI00293ED19C|nr:uncharacterized protein LOC132638352 [Lycium barbarum]
MADGSTPIRVTRGSTAKMAVVSSVELPHDNVGIEITEDEGAKYTKWKNSAQTPSNSKVSESSSDKRRKVIVASSKSKAKIDVESKGKSVAEEQSSKPLGAKNVDEDKSSKPVGVIEQGSRFFVRYLPTHFVHMSCHTHTGVFKDLKDKLTGNQLTLFGETIFGVFLQMQYCEVQSQMIRCFMLRELKESSKDAFVMDINGSILRFTIREFALITGLNCIGDEEEFKVKVYRNRNKQVNGKIFRWV